MNVATRYERINVIVSRQDKLAIIDYTTNTGRSITWVVKTLLAKLLAGDIQLDNKAPVKRKVRHGK